jgi:AcrR family transcriptional regulator
MPKDTFHNLKKDKKEKLTDAFLREFATHSFDEASITSVVKKLGIAKGSVYQYFDDKLDLFMYLINKCTEVKTKYIASIERKNFNDFWSFFRKLYECGYQFDAENPLESNFLHNLTQNLNSPTVKELYDELLEQAVNIFETMAEHEIKTGLFRNDIPVKTMGFMLYKTGVSIMEQLEFSGAINPKLSIKNNLPIYLNKKEVLMETVDNYIMLAKPAFNKK